ncbi:HAD-IC family P-type ATPase [Candidatus Saccharibacteria bacterium]|nr:HAD-IC family P-type ATPase [Candidatus Saccharibacteria bacterium]MBQ9029813.1 HAD-IC family P-type ATPase [Candidatus Saccharibacteria bacterium]
MVASIFQGLSTDEVAERLKAGQNNAPVKAPFKSTGQIIRDNTFTYFNGVFLGLAIILGIVRDFRSMTFIPVILANTLIGIVQELRAKKVLEKLTITSAREASVIRDGNEQKVPVHELVLDDTVVFRAGNQIPADAEVLDGEVSVNESLLTGEADEIIKKNGAELLSGSFIVSGECVAKLTKVGADSYASKLTLQAKAIKTGEQSEIISSLNKLVKIAGIAIIPVGILLFCRQFFIAGKDLLPSVQGGAAAVIGMIPEGLFLLASVTLAISAMRLALNKVLVHEMKCIETLARVDVLCVDKTGTITSPEMSVSDVIYLQDEKAVKPSLACLISSLSADTTTMEALKNHFKKSSLSASQVFGFSSEFKYSAAVISGKSFVLGAPEFILRDDYKNYQTEIEKYSRKGFRVLIFAEYAGKLDGKSLTKKATPLAIITLMNPVRQTAPETFRYFEENDVEIKVISGDNPLTVSEVARQAGIKNATKYIDAHRLVTDADYQEAVEKYTVFGRVLPEQKRRLVKALQSQNHTVAMTGDGVNDVLALKDADCSIAMASGSDAAVQAAQLVLLESDFSKMPNVVKEGRRVVNNLERSGSLFIVKNIFSFTAAVLAIIVGFSYPLLPAQVSMVTMWVIGVPSFFLSQMPNVDLIHGRFMTNILRKAVPGGLTNAAVVLLTYLVCFLFRLPQEQTFTACTLSFAIVGMIYLYTVCRPFNMYRRFIWLGCLAGLTLCFTVLRWFFELVENPSWLVIVIPVAVGMLTPFLLWLFTFLDQKLPFHSRLEHSLNKTSS